LLSSSGRHKKVKKLEALWPLAVAQDKLFGVSVLPQMILKS
jgi:hypothetical protein